MTATQNLKAGDTESFDTAWRLLRDGERYHFRKDSPKTQVQFAFQNHWRVFKDIMGTVADPADDAGQQRRALEVGCGRGSMAAFFANAGFETHLLDFSSEALKTARLNFGADGLAGTCTCGDALNLPFPDASFDVIVSIGLLEHFEDIDTAVREQIRILKPGGVFLGYVVPEDDKSVQRHASGVNAFLKFCQGIYCSLRGIPETERPAKKALYRNDYTSESYIKILDTENCTHRGAFGMFPVPLVSHSYDFPFSPMNGFFEWCLIKIWQTVMSVRRILFKPDPWTCQEGFGLAFLVWAQKHDQ